MSDDIVKRLKTQADQVAKWPATAMIEAAAAIEALTAERDRLRVSNMQMLGDIAVALGRIQALTAERDRLRKELEDIANDYEAGYPLSHDTIKYAARAALKGETP